MMSASSFLDLMEGKPDIRRFNRAEYHALFAAGVLHEDERVELLDGIILTMAIEGADHAHTVDRLNEHLLGGLAGRAEVVTHAAFAASEVDEPEPDLLVFASDAATQTFCAFEVAVTTQRRDRRKVAIYAHAKVPQLVFIDVLRREARVFRNPHDGDYALIELYREGTPIVIDAFPDVTVDLASVLPTATPSPEAIR